MEDLTEKKIGQDQRPQATEETFPTQDFSSSLREFTTNSYDAALAEELIAMDSADQLLRQEWRPDMEGELLQRFQELDTSHTARLKELLEDTGKWPSISSVGEEGSLAAWRLVMHADNDPDFQKTVLSAMQSSPEGEIPRWHIAYLEDRIRSSATPPQQQRFGTQFQQIDGTFQPYPPIENPEQVDALRAEYDLPPLAEDIARMNK